jgi:hypothetical protein
MTPDTVHPPTAEPVAPATSGGHSAGAAPKTARRAKRERPAKEILALAPRRLLSLEEAARYLGLSFWSFRELLNAGDVPLIRVPRPRTIRQHKRAARSSVLRRALVDVRDLDTLIDRWREPDTAPEARRG